MNSLRSLRILTPVLLALAPGLVSGWSNRQEIEARKSLARRLGQNVQQMRQNVERYRQVNAHHDWGHNQLEMVMQSFEMGSRRLEAMMAASVQSGVGISTTPTAVLQEVESLNSLASQAEGLLASHPMVAAIQPSWVALSRTLAQVSARLYAPADSGPPAGYGNPITDDSAGIPVYTGGLDPVGAGGYGTIPGVGGYGAVPGFHEVRGSRGLCPHGTAARRCPRCRRPRKAYPANQYLNPGQTPVLTHEPLPGQSVLPRVGRRAQNFDRLHGADVGY